MNKNIVWHIDYYDHMLLEDLFDEEHIEKLLVDAKAGGVDTIFWRVSITGEMSYRTKVCTPCKGTDTEYAKRMADILKKMDPLEVAIKLCRKHDLQIFVYVSVFDEACGNGEDVRWKSDFIEQHPECLLLTKAGERSSGLLCYAYEEARDYRVRQIEEILEYDPDGIFLEMRSHSGCYRGPIGFNQPLVDEYKNKTGKDPYSDDDFDYTALMRIHGEYLTMLYRQIAEVTHTHNKRLAIGITLDDYAMHVDDMSVTSDEGLGWLEVPSRIIHVDWRQWVEDGICDILVVGAGGVEICTLPWDDIFSSKYLPLMRGKSELWVWMRFYGWHGEWKLKPDGAIRKQFRDVAQAESVSGVVWHEAYDWYKPETSQLLWEQLNINKTLLGTAPTTRNLSH